MDAQIEKHADELAEVQTKEQIKKHVELEKHERRSQKSKIIFYLLNKC